MGEKDIIFESSKIFGEQVHSITPLPKAYCPGGISNVKAIYLGCDPSNKHSETLPYAFAHESGLKVFNSFLKSHTEQLEQIKLNWESVYTQNLCRNYFEKETYKNPIWKRAANEFWIDQLKVELSQFDSKIPVLLTSQILLEVLGLDGFENILAPDFYECRVDIPIPAIKNKLNRNLIPAYRGKSPKFEVSYLLKNKKWEDYKNLIVQHFRSDFAKIQKSDENE